MDMDDIRGFRVEQLKASPRAFVEILARKFKREGESTRPDLEGEAEADGIDVVSVAPLEPADRAVILDKWSEFIRQMSLEEVYRVWVALEGLGKDYEKKVFDDMDAKFYWAAAYHLIEIACEVLDSGGLAVSDQIAPYVGNAMNTAMLASFGTPQGGRGLSSSDPPIIKAAMEAALAKDPVGFDSVVVGVSWQQYLDKLDMRKLKTDPVEFARSLVQTIDLALNAIKPDEDAGLATHEADREMRKEKFTRHFRAGIGRYTGGGGISTQVLLMVSRAFEKTINPHFLGLSLDAIRAGHSELEDLSRRARDMHNYTEILATDFSISAWRNSAQRAYPQEKWEWLDPRDQGHDR